MKNLLERIWATRRRRPFRGLRRAATASGSPISCCSSACAASGAGISIPPFPRTHSTVMVIPGSRPAMPSSAGTYVSPSSSGWTPSTPRPLLLDEDDQNNNANEQLILQFPNLPPGVTNNNEGEPPVPTIGSTEKRPQSLVAQYGFQTHRPRPPLNRAIPPIPESRSNESIQSTQSRRQSGIQQQMVQMIDENNPIDAPPPREEARPRPDSMLIEVERRGGGGRGSLGGEEEEEEEEFAKGGTKRSRLPKFVRRKEKSQGEEGRQQKVPKSPLLSVAHSVKSRLSRLTHGKQTAKSGAGSEFPLSRSLEIQRQGSRIPQIAAAEQMPKSRSMEEQREQMPRRMPATTLMPSPGMGPRRLPPDEELEEERGGGGGQRDMMVKQVQFAPLPIEERWMELVRQQELPFCIWTPEKRIIRKENDERKKKMEEDEEKEEEKVEIKDEETKEETKKEVPKEMEEVPPPPRPLPPSSPPPSSHSSGPRSPPKVLLPLLRKSPQSFPPLGSLNIQSDATTVRPAKSAMSVSFGSADVKKGEGKEAAGAEKEGKRRVFTTRSLRMVATRVYEGSPLVKRRGRSESRERHKEGRPTNVGGQPIMIIGSAQLFRKSKSIPAEDGEGGGGQQKGVATAAKGKAKSFSEGGKEQKKGSGIAKLRSLKSVRTVQSLRAPAPLAESESSRVENSPAVEQCPVWEVPTKTNKENGKGTGGKRGFLFGTSARLCRKDKEKKEAKGGGGGKAPPPSLTGQPPPPPSSHSAAPRPTLAQLLASPVPRKKPAQAEATSKKDKGLIDDEIKDQPMLISTTPLGGADFRLIDEPGSSSIHSKQQPAQAAGHAVQTTPSSSSAPSSVLLVAEQQPYSGEVSVQMVQQKMQTGMSLAESKSRKRNAPKQNAVDAAKVKAGARAGTAASQQPGPSTTIAESKEKKDGQPAGSRDEEMPWADQSVKSDDGAGALPTAALLSDFRSDLFQLRDTVQRDLQELETLRLQNAILREQLAERDCIIAQLQKQLRGE